METDLDVFEEEDEFFCSLCGEKLRKEHEIIEEICKNCLACILLDEEE